MKQRVFLRRASTSEVVYLAWFELREPHDLYWGSPRAGYDMESRIIETDGSTGLLSLSAPDNWDELSTTHHRHSYHESGIRHSNAGGSGAAAIADSRHTPLRALSEPTVLCGVQTAIPARYPLYSRDLNRGNSGSVVLNMAENMWFDERHYFEFSVTPAGQVVPLTLIIVPPERQQRTPAYKSLSDELDRILAIHHLQVPLTQSRTDITEFWIIPGGQRNE
jgi:hypothetical protein